jgi:GNAT superfamily N-acetyltransferase
MTDTTAHAAAVRRAGADDRAQVIRVLTAAFLDDPVFAWIVPARDERAALLPGVFDAFAEAYAHHDETHVLLPDGEPDAPVCGVALWAPPGAEPIHPDVEDRFVARIAEVAGAHLERFGTVGEVFGAAHPSEACWFLSLLGVDAGQQGRGFGSTVLRGVLDAADLAGEPAYLEATNDRNRALYERHGFRHVGDLTLPDGPTAYAMWRDPAPSAQASTSLR